MTSEGNITGTPAAGLVQIERFTREQVDGGKWREELIPAEVLGTPRPMRVYRAARKAKRIKHDWHAAPSKLRTFCPPKWFDLAIGSGACGFGCRFCADAGTWIYTDVGPMTVKDLHLRMGERDWKVLGYDDDYRPVWTEVVAVATKPAPATMLNFHLDTGHRVSVTKDHPMIVGRPGEFAGWDGNLKASAVDENDWLPLARRAPMVSEISDRLDLLCFDWGSHHVLIDDPVLIARLGRPTTEIAKIIGQKPRADRKYPLTMRAFRGVYRREEYLQVLEAEALDASDQAVIRTPFGEAGLPRHIPLDYKFGWAIGHYLAEGSKGDREISCATHKRELAYALHKWLEAFPALNVRAEPRDGEGAVVRIAHSTLAKLFDRLVPGTAFTKRIPGLAWASNPGFCKGILAGLIFGDGHLDNFGAIIYATCSEGMAADVRQLLWQLGYCPTVVRNRYRGNNLSFQVRVQQKQAVELIADLGLPWTAPPRSRDMITERFPRELVRRRRIKIRGDRSSTRFQQREGAGDVELSSWGGKVTAGGLGLARARRITEAAPSDELVYDLQTGTGNFVAGDGVLIHNCFLMLTFRAMRDPMSPVLYDNYDDYERDVRRWLVEDDWKTDMEGRKRIKRTSRDTLGLGIDCSDSLLFEGVTGHARRIIPLFASPATNPRGNLLVMLTKSANVHYLEGLPTAKVAVTFSMNPEREADLWEGVYRCGTCNGAGKIIPDDGSINPKQINRHEARRTERTPDARSYRNTEAGPIHGLQTSLIACPDCAGSGRGERITPPVRKRLEACLAAQKMGFEVRWRLDPVLTPEGWEDDYREFFREAASMGIRPRYVTLGTYREKNQQLDLWRAAWGLVAPEWEPTDLEKDGTHRHLGADRRTEIYRTVMRLLDEAPWMVDPRVELCKETHQMRRAVGIEGVNCNCLQ